MKHALITLTVNINEWWIIFAVPSEARSGQPSSGGLQCLHCVDAKGEGACLETGSTITCGDGVSDFGMSMIYLEPSDARSDQCSISPLCGRKHPGVTKPHLELTLT